ncbi:hypothetical protein EJ06DRAFT_257784 [Trichodelitschia bisporula]|uniref:Uncharacterized protein n=1 Tax=Trichodelitschia bisporula TaxID=703511 RepID=A0A6G1HJ57_9PEZI|nr:hypothetical protein EJ06DRAFT_257784 [Trichodelitschia bisporula]
MTFDSRENHSPNIHDRFFNPQYFFHRSFSRCHKSAVSFPSRSGEKQAGAQGFRRVFPQISRRPSSAGQALLYLEGTLQCPAPALPPVSKNMTTRWGDILHWSFPSACALPSSGPYYRCLFPSVNCSFRCPHQALGRPRHGKCRLVWLVMNIWPFRSRGERRNRSR